MAYNRKTLDKITKTVRNYNAKITRLQKMNPSLSLPEKMSVKALKDISESRQELKNNLNKLKRFSKRGSENNVILPSGDIVSLYELNELRRESARLKRNLTRRINTLAETTPKVAGVKQDYTYAEMGDMRLNNMIAKRNALKELDKKIMKGGNYKNYKLLIEKTRNKQNYQVSIFKNNYLDKMLFSQAYFIGYDQEKINTIKEKLNKLSNSDFLKAFDEEKLFQMIRDKYREIGKLKGDTYFSFEQEMTDIYDEIYNNIDEFLKDYKSYSA